MHNSKNSAIGKVIFTGTQLAQARLLGISADTNNPNPNDLQEQVNHSALQVQSLSLQH